MKKVFLLIICGLMVLGLTTGCGNEKKENEKDNSSNPQQTETKKEEKKLKVGDYNIAYGYYKSKEVSVVKIMEDGTLTHGGTTYNYSVDGNHIIASNGLSLRVENETTLINDSTGSDIDTLYYFPTE